MKKVLVLSMFFVISLLGCESEGEIAKTTQYLTIRDFKQSGEIHNAFLSNVKDNFKPPTTSGSQQDKVKYINEFNRSFARTLKLDEEKKSEIINALDHNKQLVRTEHLTETAFYTASNGKTSESEVNLFENIEYLLDNRLISDFGAGLLEDYANDVKSNYEGLLSDAELKSKTMDYIADFEAHGYSAESGEGQMVGNILAISIASIEWWEENPDAFDYNNENGRVMIAPWVAADLVGAAWGGTTGAIASYAGSGEVNWTGVGVGALSGAIAGSTGAVGRIAKWLF